MPLGNRIQRHNALEADMNLCATLDVSPRANLKRTIPRPEHMGRVTSSRPLNCLLAYWLPFWTFDFGEAQFQSTSLSQRCMNCPSTFAKGTPAFPAERYPNPANLPATLCTAFGPPNFMNKLRGVSQAYFPQAFWRFWVTLMQTVGFPQATSHSCQVDGPFRTRSHPAASSRTRKGAELGQRRRRARRCWLLTLENQGASQFFVCFSCGAGREMNRNP